MSLPSRHQDLPIQRCQALRGGGATRFETARWQRRRTSKDTHDPADYMNQTKEVDAELELRRRVYLTALELGLAKRVSTYAHEQGVSTETLVNLRLSEKLSAASPGKRARLLFLPHSFEWPAVSLLVHEAASLSVSLGPVVGLGVEDLRAPFDSAIPVPIATRWVRSHHSPLFARIELSGTAIRLAAPPSSMKRLIT